MSRRLIKKQNRLHADSAFLKRAREDSNSPILKETSKIGRSESIDKNLGQVWDKI
jgi:hypothetical protein